MPSTQTPLLPIEKSEVSNRLRKIKLCVSSKPACFILLWNFAVIQVYKGLYDTTIYMQVNGVIANIASYTAGISLVAIFSTFAGVLTDIKFSRYMAVRGSSYCIVVGALLLGANGAVTILFNQLFENTKGSPYILSTNVLDTILFVTLLIPVSMYLVNALQFGMDQLHDSPTEDVVIFIHWYVWLFYVATSLGYITWNFAFDNFTRVNDITLYGILGITMTTILASIVLALLIVSICVVQYKKSAFHIEPAGVNPYKLVYRVVKFAYQHKVPLRRSAFTYCEDEYPSRMDLGKHKYGGPYTTKEVEDVKAFFGILKILLCTGLAFLLQTATQSTLPAFSRHSNLYFTYISNTSWHFYNIEGATRHLFLSSGLLSPLLVVVCIPLYLCFIRPHITYYIPGMLKRIGLGIVLTIISLAVSLAMDVVVHEKKTENTRCMFSGLANANFSVGNVVHSSSAVNITSLPLYQNVYFFTFQHFLSAVANMLLDIAVLEFTCSQSPYSMKGLLLGFFFSLKAAIEAIVVGFIFPFGLAWKSESLSCGSGYYLTLIVIGIFELTLFTFMAKTYKYRTINEPSNEYRYAEEYYSKTP